MIGKATCARCGLRSCKSDMIRTTDENGNRIWECTDYISCDDRKTRNLKRMVNRVEHQAVPKLVNRSGS